MGPIAVTITDCNGCTSTWSGFVAANVVNGCTDPNASNFDPLANTDDGSCTYPGCTDSLLQTLIQLQTWMIALVLTVVHTMVLMMR